MILHLSCMTGWPKHAFPRPYVFSYSLRCNYKSYFYFLSKLHFRLLSSSINTYEKTLLGNLHQNHLEKKIFQKWYKSWKHQQRGKCRQKHPLFIQHNDQDAIDRKKYGCGAERTLKERNSSQRECLKRNHLLPKEITIWSAALINDL